MSITKIALAGAAALTLAAGLAGTASAETWNHGGDYRHQHRYDRGYDRWQGNHRSDRPDRYNRYSYNSYDRYGHHDHYRGEHRDSWSR